MKVRVIGSGSMWNEYNSASYMIDDDILVDIPNGLCKNLYKLGIEPGKINNILITHFHGDHYFDIPFYFLLKSKSELRKTYLYCSKDGMRKIKKLVLLAFPNFKDKGFEINYEFNNCFNINDYKVNKFLVDHGRMKPAYGYIFFKDNIKVGFTGDTTICDNVHYMANVCNYLFCDCMFIEGTNKHMGINMIKELSQKYLNCKFVVSHMENNTRGELKKLNLSNVIVPEDGMIINI